MKQHHLMVLAFACCLAFLGQQSLHGAPTTGASLADELLNETEDAPKKGQPAAVPEERPTGSPRPAGGQSPAVMESRSSAGTAGEDIGRGGPDRLAGAVQRNMSAAEQRLKQSDLGAETQQLQLQVVAGLDRLLEQQRQKQSASQAASQKHQTRAEQSAANEKPDPTGTLPGEQDGNPTSGGEEGLRPPAPQPRRELNAAVKKLWGDLPARTREQMLNSGVEQFLPQYEGELREYFRKLAEEPGSK